MADGDSPSYKIGYKRPPQKTRFKSGQSGNPKGRSKGTKNLATLLGETLDEQVLVTENGRRRSISKLEAAVKQLVNKAASGEPKLIQQLLALVQLVEGKSEALTPSPTSLGEADRLVIEEIHKRLINPKSGENDD